MPVPIFSHECSRAYLPGLGFLVDPQPEHYARAIRFLRHDWGRASFAQRNLYGQFMATARRLEWTPARLRKLREAA